MTHKATLDAVTEILDRHIREAMTKSNNAKAAGQQEMMFKMNTVFHWLHEVRTEVGMLGVGEVARTTEAGPAR